MSTVKVSVKWIGKETFSDLELDTNDTPETFKAQLFALSSVSPDRIKLMLKGKVIKDDAKWSDLKVDNGTQFTMMGSAEVAAVPTEKTVFLEDLSTEQAQDVLSAGLPPGLTNLGNTCYMNATIECLRTVPELKSALLAYPEKSTEGDVSQKMVANLRDLMGRLEISTRPVEPLHFFSTMKQALPRFAQTAPDGSNMQQDAEECMGELLQATSSKLIDRAGGASESVVDKLFGIEMEETIKCLDSDAEPVTTSKTKTRRIACHIKAQMSLMHEGLKDSLTEEITKNASSIGADARFSKIARISKLPAYLTVQFVRFQWKHVEKVKAKILKRIVFPIFYDAYELCSPALQQVVDKKRAELKASPPDAALVVPATQCLDTAYYELIAVLTHQGRDAEGGHYIAWVRQDNESWLKYDDDVVTKQTDEDILKLVGGGDWHMAYVLIYRATNVQMRPSASKKPKKASE